MYRTLILLLFLLISYGINAKDFYLDLSKEHLDDRLEWSFQIDSIIDLRKEKELVGFAYKGIFNKKKIAYLKRPLIEDLQRILIAERNKQQGEKIILRINHLLLYEMRAPNQELAVAELNVSFLKKEGAHFLELFQAVSFVTRPSVDATHWMGNNLISVLSECLNDFEKRRSMGKLKPKMISPEAVAHNPYHERTFPIQEQKLQKGLYYNYYDFRDNFIDTSITFYPDYRISKNGEGNWATIDILNDSISSKSVYAFSDGKGLYLNTGRRFLEIKNLEGDLVLGQFEEESSGYALGMITSGLLGGLVGAGIYIALSEIIPNYQKGHYVLDLDKKIVVPGRSKNVEDIHGTTIFYGSSFNEKHEVMSLFINGQKVCELPPYGYYTHYSSYKNEPFDVCLKYAEKEVCKTVTPEVFKTKTMLCRIDRKQKMEMAKVDGTIESTIDLSINTGESTEVCPH